MENLSRRSFLQSGALACAGIALSGFSLPVESRINIGLIGCGQRGMGLAQLVQQIPGFALIACCDIQQDHLQHTKTLIGPNAAAYTDYRELLNNPAIAAVIIATPLYLHYDMACQALTAGKHVYLEKTMSYDIAQALSLEKKATSSVSVLQIGHQYRYYALYRKVKEILTKNWLGTVIRIECQYHNQTDWRSPVSDPKLEKIVNWRMYNAYSAGLMAELSSHQIDLVNWLMDHPPIKVAGAGGIDFYKDGRETMDNVQAIFEYPNGVKASFSALLTNTHDGYQIKLLGTKGALEISRDEIRFFAEPRQKIRGTVDGVTGATLTVDQSKEGTIIPFENPDPAIKDPTVYALLDFADCIRNKRQPLSNAHTGRATAIAIHLANKAIKEQNWQYWQQEYN